MSSDGTFYDEIGIPTVVNAVGTRTQIGGSLLHPEVLKAMQAASTNFVYMTELQASASEKISSATGAEAGLVTAGAAAGLTLGAAACIARDDYHVMRQLPAIETGRNEIVIPKAHRIKYDVALRAAGAKLIDVGITSHHPVDGGVDVVRGWEIADAITEATAAVAYVARDHNRLNLESAIEIAHEHDVPVIVDAAGELPPKSNLTRFISMGADIVSFSGGKALRGPQSTGILAGRRDLVRSAAIQHLSDGYHSDIWDPPKSFIDANGFPGAPPDGIGRPIKVCKEEIAGVLRALELFVENFDDEKYSSTINEKARYVSRELQKVKGLSAHLTNANDPLKPSRVIVRLDPEISVSAIELIILLRNEGPRIWVGENRTHLNEIYLDMKCLGESQLDYVIEKIQHHVAKN